LPRRLGVSWSIDRLQPTRSEAGPAKRAAELGQKQDDLRRCYKQPRRHRVWSLTVEPPLAFDGVTSTTDFSRQLNNRPTPRHVVEGIVNAASHFGCLSAYVSHARQMAC
jgi:hypothetical protein